MAKNEAVTVTYTAWDTSANAPKTGDVANHTIRLLTDGVASTPAASPAEVERGEYKIVIAAGENTGTMMAVIGESSTGSVVIVKASWQNLDRAKLAAAILNLDLDQVEDDCADDSVGTAMLAILHSAISGSNRVIKKTDGSTTKRTQAVTLDGDASPITGVG